MATSTARKAQKATDQGKALETIEGIVTRRIFYNAETGYCVLAVNVGGPEDAKLSGSMSSVREGDKYRFTGAWTDHPKYGRQFKFDSAELILPSGTAGVARYLSTITFGVGMAKAQKIVDSLGEDCLARLKEFPELLGTLDFLTESQRQNIAEDLAKNSVQAELAGLICREGIGQGMVNKIYGKYGQDSVRVVKENPYLLSDELWGVGFKKADAIAQTVGIAPNSPYRVEAALNYLLAEAGSEGHVYLQPSDIVRKLIKKNGLLEASGVEIPDVARANDKLISDGRCVREGDAVYSKALYVAECAVAEAIRRLVAAPVPLSPEVILDAMIDDLEKRM